LESFKRLDDISLGDLGNRRRTWWRRMWCEKETTRIIRYYGRVMQDQARECR
jgi:hypothetical protein